MAVLALGFGGALVTVVAELSPVYSIDIQEAGVCELVAEPDLRDACAPTGADRHSYALLLLAALALLMTWGAAVGRSLPAALALCATGLAVLAIALVGDLPDVNETGAIGVRFDQATAQAASGFWLSLLGGALVLAAGTGALVRR